MMRTKIKSQESPSWEKFFPQILARFLASVFGSCIYSSINVIRSLFKSVNRSLFSSE
jgi:hypothetical protein